MFENQQLQYHRMTKAIHFLSENSAKNPSLRSLADAVCASEFHVQRTFQDWVGVTPKQFLQAMHRFESKSILRDRGVTAAAEHSGYTSDSRVYDNFVRFESVTPGDYKNCGAGLRIHWGSGKTPFGDCLLAWTDRGITKLAFIYQGFTLADALGELYDEWPDALFTEDKQATEVHLSQFFVRNYPDHQAQKMPLRLFVKGTAFQVKVWEALLRLPEGHVATYQDVSNTLNKGTAVRAVASAIAKNPVGYLIPCHRVIRGCGAINQYRWSRERKASILLYEKGNELKRRNLIDDGTG